MSKTCPICLEYLKQNDTIKCMNFHSICKECYTTNLNMQNKSVCPHCRVPYILKLNNRLGNIEYDTKYLDNFIEELLISPQLSSFSMKNDYNNPFEIWQNFIAHVSTIKISNNSKYKNNNYLKNLLLNPNFNNILSNRLLDFIILCLHIGNRKHLGSNFTEDTLEKVLEKIFPKLVLVYFKYISKEMKQKWLKKFYYSALSILNRILNLNNIYKDNGLIYIATCPSEEYLVGILFDFDYNNPFVEYFVESTEIWELYTEYTYDELIKIPNDELKEYLKNNELSVQPAYWFDNHYSNNKYSFKKYYFYNKNTRSGKTYFGYF